MDAANPYAPPVTSEPSAVPEQQAGPPQRPARLLWLVYLFVFLQQTAARIWFSDLMRQLARQPGPKSTTQALSHGGLAAALLAVPPVALLGDRRQARPLLLVGLALLLLAVLLELFGDNPAFMPVGPVLGQLGIRLGYLLVLPHLLRAVTVRGIYVAMLLLEVVQQGGEVLGTVARELHDDPDVVLLGAAFCLVLALYPALRLGPPRLPGPRDDPLQRAPLPVWPALGLLLTMGGVLGLGSLIALHAPALLIGTSQTSADELWFWIPAGLLGLVLPLAAYVRGWSPRAVAVSGVVLAALGGGLLSGGSLAGGALHVPLHRAGQVSRAAGQRVLFGMGAVALLRQNLPVERIARWYALYSLSWTVMQLVTAAPLHWIDAPRATLLVASALLLPLAPALLRLTRGR